MQIVLRNNTAKISVIFYDYDGENTEPDEVTLKIYDGYGEEIAEEILTADGKSKYELDWIVPGNKKNPLLIEVTGTQGDFQTVERAEIRAQSVR